MQTVNKNACVAVVRHCGRRNKQLLLVSEPSFCLIDNRMRHCGIRNNAVEASGVQSLKSLALHASVQHVEYFWKCKHTRLQTRFPPCPFHFSPRCVVLTYPYCSTITSTILPLLQHHHQQQTTSHTPPINNLISMSLCDYLWPASPIQHTPEEAQ